MLACAATTTSDHTTPSTISARNGQRASRILATDRHSTSVAAPAQAKITSGMTSG